MKNVEVAVVMGSDSDYGVMKEAVDVLRQFDVGFDVTVTSAHRTPERTRQFVLLSEKKGVKVIIVGAGAAAHLAGVIASETLLPVVGVPIDSSPLSGADALYSTVQMPGGIPVATMAIGKAGAKNAALFSLEMLALSTPELKEKLSDYRKKMADSVEEKNRKLQERV
ncbi:MAG: 5-(carboxyamino)imidazole ribonucleotide mutase [Nitrospinota bacterium]